MQLRDNNHDFKVEVEVEVKERHDQVSLRESQTPPSSPVQFPRAGFHVRPSLAASEAF